MVSETLALQTKSFKSGALQTRSGSQAGGEFCEENLNSINTQLQELGELLEKLTEDEKEQSKTLKQLKEEVALA